MEKLTKPKHVAPTPNKTGAAPPLVSQSSDSEKKEVKKCTCSKSKCLKLYCECFAAGVPCGPDCGCKECCNNESCADLIQLAKEEIMKRDPEAFQAKVTKIVGGKRM